MWDPKPSDETTPAPSTTEPVVEPLVEPTVESTLEPTVETPIDDFDAPGYSKAGTWRAEQLASDDASPWAAPASSPATPTPAADVVAPNPPVEPVSVAPAAPAVPIVPRASMPAAPAQVNRPAVVTQAPPAKRPWWPLALLALFTIAASAGVSWFVATEVADNQAGTVTEAGLTDTEAPATTVPAVSNTITPATVDASTFEGQPFAVAAERIAPSVVQLTLQTGLGSGVIIDEDGTILTAAHVVGENTNVQVRLNSGRILDGTVLGTHELSDIAVVKIDPAGLDLVAAPIADVDDIRVGEFAIAVGSPFGFEQTVTQGIISGVDRIVNNVSMVQTDAPINPGNSGGPLINLEGHVVGINDLIFTQSGSSAGVGFAVSIDLATIVAEQIIAGEEVQLALLGVQTQRPEDGQPGALIGDVIAGTAAADAGLEIGDIVIGFNDVSTISGTQLRAQVIDSAPGTEVTLSVIRNGERIDVPVTLGRADPSQ